jgi:aryl-alcohol dehydrogenase-like predicted oxidoreductase
MPGLTVGRIGLGCGNFGGIGSAPEFFGQGLTEDQAFELMDAAWASGITHFDTADACGGGRSEQAIGRWIRRHPETVSAVSWHFRRQLATSGDGWNVPYKRGDSLVRTQVCPPGQR